MMVTLNTEEVDALKSEIAAGKLPPTAIKDHLVREEKAVFGHDVKHTRKGKPIEQGIGSKAHPTRNSVEAYREWRQKEPNYAENLARMEKELADYEAAQQVAAATRTDHANPRHERARCFRPHSRLEQ